jgi:hypothetical protein
MDGEPLVQPPLPGQDQRGHLYDEDPVALIHRRVADWKAANREWIKAWKQSPHGLVKR